MGTGQASTFVSRILCWVDAAQEWDSFSHIPSVKFFPPVQTGWVGAEGSGWVAPCPCEMG